MPTGSVGPFTLDDAYGAHDRALEHGGSPGVLNRGAIESAIARPYSGYYGSVPQMAAALVESVVGNHGFVDGNKRTAAILADSLMKREGCRLEPLDGDAEREFEEMILSVASKRLGFDDIERWFAERLRKP